MCYEIFYALNFVNLPRRKNKEQRTKNQERISNNEERRTKNEERRTNNQYFDRFIFRLCDTREKILCTHGNCL